MGLDPKQIAEVRDLIEGLARDHTVILSSHILPEVKSICKRVLIINSGRLILEDSVENLEQGGKMFPLRVKGPAGEVAQLLGAAPDVSEVGPVDRPSAEIEGYCRFMVTAKVGNAVREEIFRRLAAENCPSSSFVLWETRLEEIFLEVTA